MPAESRSFLPVPCSLNGLPAVAAQPIGQRRKLSRPMAWLQLILGYALIEITVWTLHPRLRFIWMALAGVVVLFFTLARGFSRQELGLTAPSFRSSAFIAATGLAFAFGVWGVAIMVGQGSGVNSAPGVNNVGEYILWALVQQFLLQSFFFVRLESLLGGGKAVAASAGLFAAAHLPNPILTVATLLGGLVFCSLFRRDRSIFPLGVMHALLGLTIAYSFPDALLHHMRVGIAYLTYR